MTGDEVFHTTVTFSGRVQGVGFRYQTLQVAREFEVSGYVRNLADGRVELVAEGQQREVLAFAAEVADRLDIYIRKAERSDGFREARYKGFTIAP